MSAVNIIPPQVAFVDTQGRISREWYLFLLSLFQMAGGNGNNVSDVQKLEEVNDASNVSAMALKIAQDAKSLFGLQMFGDETPRKDPDTQAAMLSALMAPEFPTKADLGLGNVSNINLSTWPGSTAITTLGTIVTGTWNAGVVQPLYGGTGVTSLSLLTANPSASVGLSAVNGSASTFMRSDAAPALDVSISPTWSGSHSFANVITSTVSGSTGTALNVTGAGTTGLRMAHVGATGSDFYIGIASSTGGTLITGSAAYSAELRNDAGFTFGVGATKVAAIDSNGITVNVATLLRSSVALTNGAGASTGTLTNAPAAGNPTKWVPISDNGTTRYIPCW